MAIQYLDCKGLCCPMPIVQVARKFRGMEIGDILEVEADDPAFQPDIEAWADCMGQKLSSINIKNDNIVKAVLEKMQ
jgi:tRNA 2-thiouridine synthesizing protein A